MSLDQIAFIEQDYPRSAAQRRRPPQIAILARNSGPTSENRAEIASNGTCAASPASDRRCSMTFFVATTALSPWLKRTRWD